MNIELPDQHRTSNGEVTYGVRVVNGKPHKLEFYNSPKGMMIIQINHRRPWATTLATVNIADVPERERFK